MSYYRRMESVRPVLERIRGKQLTVISALGDSNTCNASFADGCKHWPELVHTELRIHCVSQRVLLVNAGICGDTAAGALDRLDSDVLRFGPSMVLVSFGSNDAGRYTPELFRENMEMILERVEKAGALAVLRTSPPVMELEPSPPHIWLQDSDNRRLSEEVCGIADDLALPLIDHYGWWHELEKTGNMTIASLMHDCVHPNARGHQLLARQVLESFGFSPELHWERGEGEAPGA